MPTYPTIFTDGDVLYDHELDQNVAHRESRNQKGSILANNTVSVGIIGAQVVAANSDRTYLMIMNVGTANVYVGASGVTTSDGFLIEPNGWEVFLSTEAVFVISGSASQEVRYLEVDSA